MRHVQDRPWWPGYNMVRTPWPHTFGYLKLPTDYFSDCELWEAPDGSCVWVPNQGWLERGSDGKLHVCEPP
jgi:hypothetical protein